MLTRLSIRNVVLIDKLDLDFESGLTVLTGETGAGKSILLDSLSLALSQQLTGIVMSHTMKARYLTVIILLSACRILQT